MSRPGGVKRFILVAKPGIVFGNLVSAAGGFFLAAKGRPDIAVLVPTMTGIALVVASGCVFNNCIDRDVDRKMARTRHRVLAQGLMTPVAAVCYATLLGIAGMALLAAATNGLAAGIVLAGFVIYVGLYSLWLKRQSVYATLIGSLAGAAPPLAGYCAISGRFDLGAVILLSIFSLWQIPHSYAIAVFRYDDYARAHLPVFPLKRKLTVVKNHIVGYIIAFTAAALMPTLGGYAGCSYLAAAAVTGLLWLVMALAGYNTTDNRLWAGKMFAFSILTIFVLSVMMSVDATVPATSAVHFTFVP
ncbi:MAG: heme o synthase [Desulfobacterales bacterium]